MPKDKKDEDSEEMGGFPKDGDALIEDEDEDELEEDSPPSPPPSDIEVLKTENAELRRRMDQMQQDIAVAKQPKKEEEPDNFYEGVDERLFQNPTEVLKGMEARIIAGVSKEMTTSYKKDQGERDFWNDFYGKYPDLKVDDDLVKATLNGNMSSLGGLPVSEAVSRLADLTRDRIARYAKAPRKRPHTEGARSPTPNPAPKEPNKVVTLSDVIRQRRNRRRGTAA